MNTLIKLMQKSNEFRSNVCKNSNGITMVTLVNFECIPVQEGLCKVESHSKLWHGILLRMCHANELHIELKRQRDLFVLEVCECKPVLASHHRLFKLGKVALRERGSMFSSHEVKTK